MGDVISGCMQKTSMLSVLLVIVLFFTTPLTALADLPLYSEEGKTNLTVAIGCPGGKHRSVTVANKLGEEMNKKGYVYK